MLVQYDPEKKVWHGPVQEYSFGNQGVAEVAYNNLRSNLQHIAQISDDSDEVYTAERMLKAAISFAQAIKSKGIEKGDNVLTLMDNHHYMMPAWLGSVFAETVLCPFAMTDSSVIEEIGDIIDQIQPKIFVTSRVDLVEDFKSIFKKLNLDCPIYIYENKVPGCHDLKPLLERDVSIEEFKVPKVKDAGKEVALLMLSSATTGKPKLINATHMQLLSGFTQNMGNHIITSTNKPGWFMENILAFGCLYHPYTRIITAKNFTIDEYLKMIERYKVTMVAIKPKDIFTAIRSKTIKSVDLSSLRLAGSGGQHLSPNIAEEFQSYIKNGLVINVYGITDVGISITSVNFGEKTTPGSVGQINANVSVRIVNEDGVNVGPNELGEIYVKSNIPFSGYYKNEKLTKAALDAEGYYITGDVGYVDDRGNVFLVDRKKFLISYGGEFLNQAEIEKIVMDYVKGVEAVCVVDIEHEKYNVVPIICIIPEHDAILDEQEIIKTVHKYYKRTFFTRVFLVDDMPITLSGKYKKYLVREQILKLMK